MSSLRRSRIRNVDRRCDDHRRRGMLGTRHPSLRARMPASPRHRHSPEPTARRLVALRDGRPAAAVIARIRALGGTVVRSHQGAGIVIASGLTDAAVQSLAQQRRRRRT